MSAPFECIELARPADHACLVESLMSLLPSDLCTNGPSPTHGHGACTLPRA